MVRYRGLTASDFRHPLDLQAEQALRTLPGFEAIARQFMQWAYERPQTAYLLANAVQVGPQQYGSLYKLLREGCQSLDLQPEPSLFLVTDARPNSSSLGQDQPLIVLHSGLVDLLEPLELQAAIARELGHLKCGHSLLGQMALWVMDAATTVGELTLGIGNLLNRTLLLAFGEWQRKAELSADRAALLACGDFQTVVGAIARVAGGCQRYAPEFSVAAVLEQADRAVMASTDPANLLVSSTVFNQRTPSDLAERILQLRQWSESEGYRQLRRKAEEEESLRRQVAELEAQVRQFRRQG